MEIKNGFQSNINEYKCLLFFSFDNIFTNNNKFDRIFSICKGKNYTKFMNLIRNKFIEIK